MVLSGVNNVCEFLRSHTWLETLRYLLDHFLRTDDSWGFTPGHRDREWPGWVIRGRWTHQHRHVLFNHVHTER